VLLFARYVALRDVAGDELPDAVPGAPAAERRRHAFLANRGLQELDGKPKAGWREWVREAGTVKR
jgi:hypothetical protein